MTEDQIERAVERKMDALDARLMSNALTQAEYNAETKALNDWADAQYAKSHPTTNDEQ